MLRRLAPFKNDVSLLFTVLVWGVNMAVIKAAVEVMHPHVLNVFRFVVSAAVIGWIYELHRRHRGDSFFGPLRARPWSLLALGLFGFYFYQLCFIVGINFTTAGSTALIMASAPLWTTVLGHVFRIERIARPTWWGLLVMICGVALIVLGSRQRIEFGAEVFLGNVLILLAAMLWGGYTAFSKPLSRDTSPISLTFFGTLIALPLLAATSMPYFDTVDWAAVDTWVWAAILFSGGLSTGLAVVIWYAAVKNVGPSQTAAYGNLVPVIGLVSGVLLLGETVVWTQVAGGTLILGGLVLVRRNRRPLSLPA